MSATRQRVALVGLRASGKTTVGRELARLMGRPWRDADEVLGAEAGMPAGEVLRREGEPAFRAREARIASQLLCDDATFVVSLGGGAVMDPRTRQLLQRPCTFTVLLHAPLEVLAARIRASGVERPALTSLPLADELAELWRVREPLYREVADLVLDTAAMDPAACAGMIRAGFSSS